MRRLLVALLTIVVSPAVSVLQPAPSTKQRPLAFVHVTVVDATGTPAQPDMTVVVSGNRITDLGRFPSVNVPRNAQSVDAKGQFMIPGLWDMHTHAFLRKNKILPLLTLRLYIGHGITGVRDMGDQSIKDGWGDFLYAQDFEWRQAIAAGAALGPRLNLAGVLVDGPKPFRAGWASVQNEAEARELVVALKRLGADLIKPYDGLPRGAYFALADEAKKQGLLLGGHTPLSVSAAEASDAGQRSIEHLTGVLLASSKDEERFRKAILAGQAAPDIRTLLDSYDDDKAKRLFARFAKNGTYHVPTLIGGRLDPLPMSDPRIVKYFTPALREEYAASLKQNPVNAETRKLAYETKQRLVRDMHRSGVTMLAGTDTRSFGSDLHDELAARAERPPRQPDSRCRRCTATTKASQGTPGLADRRRRTAKPGRAP